MNHNDPATLLPPVPSGPADSRSGPADVGGEEPQPFLRGVFGIDVALCALTLLVAGLLASVPARNSDVWLHLAAGRGLIDGTYQFGTDPFSHTTSGEYWVNHDWLYDVASYGLYRAAGGTGLVVVKVLITGVLALMLLRLGRAGRAFWMPAVGATPTLA